jgi:HK97 gp10 family phage protein
MDGVEIKVDLQAVNKALFSYGNKLGNLVVRRALREGAKLVLQQARANAPKRTGALRRALRIANSRINNGKRGVLGVYLSIRKGRGRKDPRDAFYGRFQEGGYTATGGKTIGGGKVRREQTRQRIISTGQARFIPGKFFIRNAYMAQKVAAANVIIKSAERGAEIVARQTGLK